MKTRSCNGYIWLWIYVNRIIFKTLNIQVLRILMSECIVCVFWISTLQSNKTFKEFSYVWTNLLHKSEIRIFLNFVHDDMQAKYTTWFFCWACILSDIPPLYEYQCVCIIVVCHSDPYIHKEKHYPTSTTTFLACVRGKLWQW